MIGWWIMKSEFKRVGSVTHVRKDDNGISLYALVIIHGSDRVDLSSHVDLYPDEVNWYVNASFINPDIAESAILAKTVIN